MKTITITIEVYDASTVEDVERAVSAGLNKFCHRYSGGCIFCLNGGSKLLYCFFKAVIKVCHQEFKLRNVHLVESDIEVISSS